MRMRDEWGKGGGILVVCVWFGEERRPGGGVGIGINFLIGLMMPEKLFIFICTNLKTKNFCPR